MAYSLLQSLHEIHNYSQKPTFANKNTIVEELAGMVTTFYHLSLPWDLKGRQTGPGATAVRWPSHGQGRRDGAGTVPGRCKCQATRGLTIIKRYGGLT